MHESKELERPHAAARQAFPQDDEAATAHDAEGVEAARCEGRTHVGPYLLTAAESHTGCLFMGDPPHITAEWRALSSDERREVAAWFAQSTWAQAPTPTPPAGEEGACGATDPTNTSVVPCDLPEGHDGIHRSSTGCAGSVMTPPAGEDVEASIRRGLEQSARGETVDLGDFTQYAAGEDVERVARAVMEVADCDITIDSGDCMSCGSAPCGPHPDFAYCTTHDWEEAWDPESTVCPWATRIALAALSARPVEAGEVCAGSVFCRVPGHVTAGTGSYRHFPIPAAPPARGGAEVEVERLRAELAETRASAEARRLMSDTWFHRDKEARAALAAAEERIEKMREGVEAGLREWERGVGMLHGFPSDTVRAADVVLNTAAQRLRALLDAKGDEG